MIRSNLLAAMILILAVLAMVVEASGQQMPRGLDYFIEQRLAMKSPSWLPALEKSAAADMAPQRTQVVPGRKQTVGICGNPKLPCRTDFTFQPFDLPFRVPNTMVLYETELFYAVILKSKPAPNDDCDIFFSETERLSTQDLFPEKKVFASRCADPETLFYSNIKRDTRIMAVYAGKTLAEANRTLSEVKATGKFPGAYIRRMRTGFNGT